MKINPIIPTRQTNQFSKSYVKKQAFMDNSDLNFKANSSSKHIKEFFEMMDFIALWKSFKDMDINKLQSLNIQNLRIIDKNLVSGATFETRPVQDLKKLKKNGIESIIDFREEASSNFAKICKKMNIDYFNFILDNVMNFQNEEYFIRHDNKRIIVRDEFVKELKKFFNTVNTQKTYMGCHFGVDRTNLSVVMNYLLNPKSMNAPDIITWPGENKKTIANKNIKVVKRLVKYLDKDQKQELDIPENYGDELNKRIYILLLKNNLL